MTPPRRPLDATIDTVEGALSVLWDWLGQPTEAQKAKAQEIAAKVEKGSRDPRIPAVVIDTEGEEAP